jgi:hypothetical protein
VQASDLNQGINYHPQPAPHHYTMPEPKPEVTWEEIKAQIAARKADKAEKAKKKRDSTISLILSTLAILFGGGYLIAIVTIWNNSSRMAAEQGPPSSSYSDGESLSRRAEETSSNYSSSNESGWAESHQSEAYAKCYMDLKDSLRNPDSLKEEGWTASGEILSIKYRAENGLGGMNRETRLCQFDASGEIISRTSI